MKFDLPFDPIRSNLYTTDELYLGIRPGDVKSFVLTPDFAIYKFWVSAGKSRPNDYIVPMMQALHDNSITQALLDFVKGSQVLGIMGGHNLRRSDPDYAKIARIARQMSKNGFLIMTGGGPGAMEAAHLGAWYRNATNLKFSSALQKMASAKPQRFPIQAGSVVSPKGKVDMDIATSIAAWLRIAFEVKEDLKKIGGRSLGVPTWQYGHEPSTPFASSIAKYFENSVREDGLVTVASGGIIYAQGSAGTIQEIFQDACVNFYGTRPFSPMVFLNVDYWENKYPVIRVLQGIFKSEQFEKYVHVTDDEESAIKFLTKFQNPRTGR